MTLIFRVMAAAVLGGVIGMEREWQHKPAGFRTIMLVTLGTALAILLAQRIPLYTGIPVEMGRVFSGILEGVGFLGAGTIFNKRNSVEGLTTAAGIWVMAGVGIAVGVGDWALAIAGTILCFLIMRVLDRLSDYLVSREEERGEK